MKILIIDSHKSSESTIPQNLHWQNAKILADELKADLIWSYPNVNDNVKNGYDVIIFNHASPYAFIDIKWLNANPNAKLFYITNEYNLGEPMLLWLVAKAGRKYDVIANHSSNASKVVTKYTDNWNILNLNSLCFKQNQYTDTVRNGCIYYGSFRKDRSEYFKKYLTTDITLSTHSKNISKFRDCGSESEIIKRVDWSKTGILNYKYSLYIEDCKTHTNFNYLANRFYEALNYGVVPIFGEECINTIKMSGYNIPDSYIIKNTLDIKNKELFVMNEWYDMAVKEKTDTIENIKNIIFNI